MIGAGHAGIEARQAAKCLVEGIKCYSNGWDSLNEHGVGVGAHSVVRQCIVDISALLMTTFQLP